MASPGLPMRCSARHRGPAAFDVPATIDAAYGGCKLSFATERVPDCVGYGFPRSARDCTSPENAGEALRVLDALWKLTQRAASRRLIETPQSRSFSQAGTEGSITPSLVWYTTLNGRCTSSLSRTRRSLMKELGAHTSATIRRIAVSFSAVDRRRRCGRRRRSTTHSESSGKRGRRLM